TPIRGSFLSYFAGVAVTCASGAETTSAFVFAFTTEIASLPTSMARLGLKLPVLASEYEAPARVDHDTSQQRVGCSFTTDPSLPLISGVSRSGPKLARFCSAPTVRTDTTMWCPWAGDR